MRGRIAPSAPVSRAGDAAADRVPLATTAAFFDALNRDGIRYCHWKSNLRLSWGLAGRTDLDVLVDPRHARRLQDERLRFRIVAAVAPAGKRYPSIEDCVGFDPASGKLFHLHVHYRLILGEQFVKNYRLPLEEAYLDGAVERLGVMVPAPELELLVLSLRALLKYRDRDAVKDMLGIRSPGLPAHILDEVDWLLDQTTPEDVRAVAERRLPEVKDLVIPFLAAAAGPRDGGRLLHLRGRARAALRVYRRDSRPVAVLRYLRESVRRRKRLRFGPPRRMALTTGLAVAFVGADGAGKTTLTNELAGWLGGLLETRRYYQGSKEPSPASNWLYTAFRAGRRAHRAVAARLGEQSLLARPLAVARDACLHAHYLSTALDRYRRNRAGRRAKAEGAVVIYDRFPLTAALDGPQIAAAGGKPAGLFARLEASLYRRFAPPDLLVILRVDPETSMTRKPDHRREVVESKARFLDRLIACPEQGPTSRLVVVDANRPYAEVLDQARRAVWDAVSA